MSSGGSRRRKGVEVDEDGDVEVDGVMSLDSSLMVDCGKREGERGEILYLALGEELSR